ncbi:outer membrane lipoprotein carrier protein LolA [Candidatus Pelagibacter sp.]|nr:outer membrane lipoprotein carrier protein LolA [Candidatus Pelagibacter sp.]
MRYLIFFLFIIFSSNLNASVKNEIKKNLEKTDNVYFKFIQKINNKTEKGECKLLYPKKIYCKYDDIYEKVMVSNGRSLLINSKKIKNYLNYKLKDTPLDLILDKNFLLKKIEEVQKINENNENYYFITSHHENSVTIFFDKQNYYLKGWTTKDIYQNEVETLLINVETNLMIDENIFKLQKYIN